MTAKKRVTANIWWIIIFMILLGVFLICMPKYVDDHLFLVKFTDWFFNQGITNPEWGGNFIKGGFPWEEMLATWSERYALDNSRFGNMLAVFFLLLPKWVGSSLAVLSCVWTFISGLQLVGIDIRRSALVPVGLLLFSLFIPWQQHMGSLDFQFNYILSTGLQMGLLFILCKPGVGKRGQWLRIAGAFMIGLLAGGWQEALSIPVLCGLVFIFLTHKSCRRSVMVWGIVGTVVGLLWILTAPGQWVRIGGNEFVDADKLTFRYAARVVTAMGIYWVMVFMLIMRMIGHRKDRHALSELVGDVRIQFIIISGLASTGILFFTYADARVGWWGSVCGIFGILYLLSKYHYSYWERYTKRNIMPATIFLLLALGQRVWVDMETFKFRSNLMASIDRYTSAPDSTVFVDIPARNFVKILTNTPAHEAYVYADWGIREFYKHKYDRAFNMVPEILKYVDAKNIRCLPGTAGMMEYQGHYLMPFSDMRPVVEFMADYGNGKEKLLTYLAPFTSKGDGKEYYYVYFCQNWYDAYIRELERVDLPEN